MADALPAMYTNLASWFHLLSPPALYAADAALYRDMILAASASPPRTLLELGSGGGNNASHLKRDFICTLVDPAPAMLDLSRRINPECEHLIGDMRSLRLGRTFDVVFVHDAVVYMTTEADLLLAMHTAAIHLRPGGVALFSPDAVRETFVPSTAHGGSDGDGRGARYVEWAWDPDPSDTTYLVHYAYLLREGDTVRADHEQHVEGIFPRATWLRLLAEAGFAEVRTLPRVLEGEEYGEVFVAVRGSVPAV